MCPCNPNNLSLNLPSGPNVPALIPFGIPFAPSLPDFSIPIPTGFPEDLLGLLDLLQFLLPSGVMKPSLSINFGKDIFDGILSLLDKFLPFLMLYKFFLPVLGIILCIIEVLCALKNPFKLISKIKRLFRVCLPAFLSLFPFLALIIMLLSLLFLILKLIEYIIAKILEFINLLLKNINGLIKAFQLADQVGILAMIRKIGLILCSFQNLFVLLAIFKTIIDVIKEIVKLVFAVPPCDDGQNLDITDTEKCCSTDVCPAFIKNNELFQRSTGTLQYLNQVELDSGLNSLIPGLPTGFLTQTTRDESWQFYDSPASIQEAFYNITKAYDLPPNVNTIFFPTDAIYTSQTPPNQVPYLLDMRLLYNPSSLGRIDPLGIRYIKIFNCIVLNAPTQNLKTYNNEFSNISNGVLNISGGIVYEDDGTTPININNVQATLNTLIHKSPEVSTSVVTLLPTDGYLFSDVAYTFHIQHEILLSKDLITLGCIPSVALDRTFINTTFGGNAGTNFALLNNLLNGDGISEGQIFPDIGATQQCLNVAITALRSNMGPQGVANFQTMSTVCLNKLQSDTNSAISSLLGIGFDQYHSTFTVTPNIQFTTQSIEVQVSLNETNGQLLTNGMPANLGEDIAPRIKPTITFGNISDFVYDGYQFFNAKITSESAGSGTLKISFDNKQIGTVTIPASLDKSPFITETVLAYTFIYSPSNNVSNTGEGDTDGKPRFNESDSS